MQADREQVTRLIKTARGQLDGILRMIEQDRYCVDVATQLMATQSILKRATREVLHAHMTHCVRDAVNGQDAEQKLQEITKILDQLL